MRCRGSGLHGNSFAREPKGLPLANVGLDPLARTGSIERGLEMKLTEHQAFA